MTRLPPLDETDVRRLRTHFNLASGDLPKALAVEVIAWCLSQGIDRQADLAKVLGRSPTLVRKYLPEAQASLVDDKPTAKATSDEMELMRTFTVEGFECFYNRYSGNVLAGLHRGWVEAFINNRATLLACPPKHAKSHIAAIWIPLWLIARDRDTQVMVVSQSATLADNWIREVAAQLTANTLLIEDFGRFSPESKAQANAYWRPNSGVILVTGRETMRKGVNASYFSRSRRSATLGFIADVVIVDDCEDREVADSPTEHERTMDWLRGEALSRVLPALDPTDPSVGPQGHLFVVQQRVHEHDVVADLAQDVKGYGPDADAPYWRYISQPAVSDGKALWPEFWSYEELMEVKALRGPVLWECMYQQNPTGASSVLMRVEWQEPMLDRERDCFQQRSMEDEEEEHRVRVYSIDTSSHQWNCGITANLFYDPKDYRASYHRIEILKIDFWKSGNDGAKAGMQLIEKLRAAVNDHGVDCLVIEQVPYLKQVLASAEYGRVIGDVRVIWHTTGSNKNSEMGVMSLAADFAACRISIPYATAVAQADADEFYRECRSWPRDKRSDGVMALWFIKYQGAALRNVKLGRAKGFSTKKEGGWGYLRREGRHSSSPDKDEMAKWYRARATNLEQRREQRQKLREAMEASREQEEASAEREAERQTGITDLIPEKETADA